MTDKEKTLEEKVAIVLEMLKGKASVEAICHRHQVSISDAYHWCALFLDGAKKALEEGRDDGSITKGDIERLRKIISEE
jgi:transposase-like protein